MTADEIAIRFAHAWPTTTRRLGALTEARLLRVEKRGRERICRLEHEPLALLNEWLSWFSHPSGMES